MRHALLLIALLAFASPAFGDGVAIASWGNTAVYRLCNAVTPATGDCADMDISSNSRMSTASSITFALVDETGTGCIFTPKGRNTASEAQVDILGPGVTLTTADIAERSSASWWRYLGGTVSGGSCNTATVYVKFQRAK